MITLIVVSFNNSPTQIIHSLFLFSCIFYFLITLLNKICFQFLKIFQVTVIVKYSWSWAVSRSIMLRHCWRASSDQSVAANLPEQTTNLSWNSFRFASAWKTLCLVWVRFYEDQRHHGWLGNLNDFGLNFVLTLKTLKFIWLAFIKMKDNMVRFGFFSLKMFEIEIWEIIRGFFFCKEPPGFDRNICLKILRCILQ